MIAALYVQADGCYAKLPGVDPWPEARDARQYAGPWSVVAHPECKRWGKFATGAPNKPNQYRVGDDDGCFAAALAAVERWGGVLEHPTYSKAWKAFGLIAPIPSGGWSYDGVPQGRPGYVCHVEQGHYGHFSRKPTWLYACVPTLPGPPDLIWGPSPQRIHPRALELHGYEKARRIGVMAMVGGKDKSKIRAATPPAFRDLLLSIAATARQETRDAT